MLDNLLLPITKIKQLEAYITHKVFFIIDRIETQGLSNAYFHLLQDKCHNSLMFFLNSNKQRSKVRIVIYCETRR